MASFSTDPKRFNNDDKQAFTIEWKDGHLSNYDAFRLRVICPCAECRGGHGGKIGDNTGHIKPPININDYDTVGRYALSFHFDDNHRGGIFSFDYLRQICPCDVCKEDAAANYKS